MSEGNLSFEETLSQQKWTKIEFLVLSKLPTPTVVNYLMNKLDMLSMSAPGISMRFNEYFSEAYGKMNLH